MADFVFRQGIILDEILRFMDTPQEFLTFALINKSTAKHARFRSLSWRRKVGVWLTTYETYYGYVFEVANNIHAAFANSLKRPISTNKVYTELIYITFDNYVAGCMSEGERLGDCLYYWDSSPVNVEISHFGEIDERGYYSDDDMPEYIDDDLDPWNYYDALVIDNDRRQSMEGRIEAGEELYQTTKNNIHLTK